MLVHTHSTVKKIRAGSLVSESCKAAEGHGAIGSLEVELPCLQHPSGGVEVCQPSCGSWCVVRITLLCCATCVRKLSVLPSSFLRAGPSRGSGCEYL